MTEDTTPEVPSDIDDETTLHAAQNLMQDGVRLREAIAMINGEFGIFMQEVGPGSFWLFAHSDAESNGYRIGGANSFAEALRIVIKHIAQRERGEAE